MVKKEKKKTFCENNKSNRFIAVSITDSNEVQNGKAYIIGEYPSSDLAHKGVIKYMNLLMKKVHGYKKDLVHLRMSNRKGHEVEFSIIDRDECDENSKLDNRFVVVYVDYGDSCDGKARILCECPTYNKAEKKVFSDIRYVARNEDAEADLDNMWVCDDDSLICKYLVLDRETGFSVSAWDDCTHN